MKSINFILFLGIITIACNSQTESNSTETAHIQADIYNYYGDSTSFDKSETLSSLVGKLEGTENIVGTYEVNIAEVCQSKGCWLNVDLPNGEKMKVTFKDYGFFVPINSSGKKAYLNGEISVKLTSVEELQHYAEDAGKSPEEIAKITEPKEELHFVASGVKIME